MDGTVRVAIVEDIEADRALLRDSLRRYGDEKGIRFELREFQDGEDLVTGYTADYDILLLDIMMTFMDGMTTARRIRELDRDVVIVFITGTPQFAIEGYKVGAADYVLKPISQFSFTESMNRALNKVRPRTRETISIPLKGGRTRLDIDRICYVEVQDHQLIYNTRDGRYVTKGTMRDVEAQLNRDDFYRCNRCYVVNLKYVKTCVGFDILVNGDTIQVSRSRRKGFMDALNLYMNGDGA